MDFHSLARRDLQALCKKNKIAANQTNVAMADALQALQSIEWDEEIRQKLMPQSEPLEQHCSPLPRSRRVSAVSSDISSFPLPDEVDEMKKEALIEAIQTPATAVRRSQRIQSAMGTRTRARTSATGTGTGVSTGTGKKEEALAEASAAAATPAPQRGRKKAAAETPAPVPRSSARPTRQSTRKLPESMKGTRATRTMDNLLALEANDVKEAHAAEEQVVEQLLAADEKLDSVEQNVEQIESTEEIVTEESENNAALPVSEDKDEIPQENSTGNDESEKSLEEELTGEITDQKEIPSENSVEDVADVGPDTNATPISEEEQVDLEKEGQVNETALTDSPIMGLVSEAVPEVPESNADLQDAPTCDITLDAQDAPPCEVNPDAQDAPPCDIITPDAQDAVADLSLASPVRAPNDVGVERMLDSVVRRFAKASINSAKKTDATTEKAATVVEPAELTAQNENAVKEKVDLQNMSLRKLKAMYKDRLIELNSKKVVAEEGKRLPLGNLDKNIQGNMV